MPAQDIGRTPDFILKVKRKDNGDTAKQGAAWINYDGKTLTSITIKLNPCCVLMHDPNILITLFPPSAK